MGFIIEDGKGSGVSAEVNKENQLIVRAIIENELEHASSADGNSYTWEAAYNYTGGDTILLVKNTGEKDLHIDGVWLSGDTDTIVTIHVPTVEVTPAGTAVTGRNLNTGSSRSAVATAKENETDNTQGDIYWPGEIMAVDSPYYVDFKGAMILAQNKSLGVDYVTTGGACNVVIIGHFED